MGTLNKRLFRLFKHGFAKYLGVFLLLTFTIMLVSGFLVSAKSVKAIYDTTMVDNCVEAGNFVTATSLDLTALTVKDVQFYANGYVQGDLVSDQADVNGDTVRLYNLALRQAVNIPILYQGAFPQAADEVALDRLFMANNHLAVGDNITLLGATYRITGACVLPDYSSLFENNDDLMFDALSFGVGVLSEAGYAALDDAHKTNHYAYVFTRDLTDAERTATEKAIKTAVVGTGTTLVSFTNRADNQAISFVMDDMGSDVPMMKAIMFILLAIIAFMFVVLANSTIDHEAPIIGALYANGYRRRELIAHYLCLPLLVTVLAGVVGNLLGYTVFANLFKNVYYHSYCFAPFRAHFDGEALVYTTLLPLVMVVLVNWIGLWWKLRHSPLDFLRGDLTRHKKQRALKLSAKIPFSSRFRLRLTLRHKGNYAIMFCGIFFATLILMFVLAMQPSIDHYTASVQDTCASNYQYLLTTPVETDVADAEKFSVFVLQYRDADIIFYGLVDDNRYFQAPVADLADSTMIISSSFAGKYGLRVGKTLTFTNQYNDAQYQLTVAGIQDYAASMAVFLPQSTLNRLIGGDYLGYNFLDAYDADTFFNGYLSDTALPLDRANVAKTITQDDLNKLSEQMTSSMGGTFQLVKYCAIIIYVVIIYILTRIVLEKSANQIALMKVFGYSAPKVAGLYLVGISLAVLVSSLLCLPLAYWAFRVIFAAAMSMVSGYLPPYVPAYVFGVMIVACWLSYAVVAALHYYKINRIKMAEALKNRE